MPVSRNSTGMSGLSWAAMCNSTADSAPNDETIATLSPNRSMAAPRMACGSASRSSAFSRATRLAASSPSNAMIGLQPLDKGRLAAVGGALIDVAETADHLAPLGRGRAVGGFEGVDAGADHEAGLFAQHVADRPHLAGKAALAQDGGRGISLALQVFREGQR